MTTDRTWPSIRMAILPLAMLVAGPAHAAGGAHVVDDDAIESPGTCHAEAWLTTGEKGQGLTNFGPGCTLTLWPDLELDGYVTHGWSQDSRSTVIGIAPKILLRPERHGFGVALDGSLGFGLDHGRLETASLIVPVSFAVAQRLRLNVNAGAQWARATDRYEAFAGAQAEYAVDDVSVMVEAFGHNRGKPGEQAGLRWTTDAKRIDLDVIGGRYVDGATPTQITFGITLRR